MKTPKIVWKGDIAYVGNAYIGRVDYYTTWESNKKLWTAMFNNSIPISPENLKKPQAKKWVKNQFKIFWEALNAKGE